ncbi:MAG: hypothetical protein V1944_02375 [Candidatus Aenigmatarchaeota archaeon]
MPQRAIPVLSIVELLKARYGYYGTYSGAWKKSHSDWSSSPENQECFARYNVKHSLGLYGFTIERTVFNDFLNSPPETRGRLKDAYLKKLLQVVHSSKSNTIVDEPKNDVLRYVRLKVLNKELEEFAIDFVSGRMAFLSKCLQQQSFPPPTCEAIDKRISSNTFVTPVRGNIDLILRNDVCFREIYELKVKSGDLYTELRRTIPGSDIPTLLFDVVQAGIYGEMWNAQYRERVSVFVYPVPHGPPLRVNHSNVAKLVMPLIEELNELSDFDFETIQKLDETMRGVFKQSVDWKSLVVI